MSASGAFRRVLSRKRASVRIGRNTAFTPKMRLPTLWPRKMPSASRR